MQYDTSAMSIVRTELAPAGSAAAEPAPASTSVDHPSLLHPSAPLSTRAEWNAAGVSLLLHLLVLLALAALLIPVRTSGHGTSLDGGLGDEGDGDLFDSVTIGSPAPGKGEDLERLATTTVEAVPALEGAMAGGSGSGSSGSGRFDAIAALGAGGGGGGGHGVGFFGTTARAETVVFVVDMSGSMQGHRFDRALEELTRSLNKLQSTQKFFVFFFNNQTYPLFDQHNPKLLPATAGTRARALKWLKSLHPDGGTFPEDAIERALKLKPQVIYFLTDGEIPETTRDVAQKWNGDRKVVIHTIAFETEEGAEMLRAIARDARGKYRFVP